MDAIEQLIADYKAMYSGSIPNPITRACNRCERQYEPTCVNQVLCPRCQQATLYRSINAMDRKFVVWDGEGEDGKYTLLANSKGDTLINRDGLSTTDCLDFLLNHSRRNTANNVWFAFGYDVSMIMKDITLDSIEELHANNELQWKGYTITYIPRKVFSIYKRIHGRNLSFVSYDVFSFFQTSFVKTISSWLGETPSIITEGKEARDGFRDWEMDKIVAYNAAECELLVKTMDKFRSSVRAAGMHLQKWYGPGAIAKEWLKDNNIADHIAPLPPRATIQVMRAYFGGRIELAAWGRAEHIWHYDINSAYPTALTYVPSLTNLKWQLNDKVKEIDDFDLVHVNWSIPMRKGPFLWGPLPYREKNGTILFPYAGEGWYWGVEVKSALRRFPQGIVIVEAWHGEGERFYPFREPILRDAGKRLQWKKEGNPAHIPMKLALNSLYGVLAQKFGYVDKKGEYHNPKFQCYPWAGFITAYTRAMLNDAIGMADGKVVCVMTDSVWSMQELPNLDIGPGLGQWEYSPEDASADFCGAGLYQSYDKAGNPREKEYKSRGFSVDQGSKLDYRSIISGWEASLDDWTKAPVIKSKSRRFVGIGLTLATNKYKEARNSFVEIEKSLDNLATNGYSKRFGYTITGRMDAVGGLHYMIPAHVDVDDGQRDIWGGNRIPVSAPYMRGKMERELGEDGRIGQAWDEDEGE